ncbi:gliding motility-associated C-terminal domain-containing protein, partial [Maribacter sp.]|nr:gliding motility-associated C-terminal domain-containing protein [Maribacter sp.]
VFRYTVTGTGACSDDFAEVTISVSDCDPCIAGNVAPILDITVPRVFCDDISVTSLNQYTASIPPTGTVLRWSLSEPTDTVIPAAVSPANPMRGTYYGYFYDAVNDCASPALQVIITLNTAPVIDADNTSAGTRCGPGPVTFTAAANGNATFNWYTSEVGGAVLFSGDNVVRELTQTTTYYLVATENGCPSPRLAVTGTVLIQPSSGTAAMGASSCSNSAFGTTTLDLDTLLTDADAGDWVFTSGPSDVPINAENIVDFSTRINGDYVYTFTTSGAQDPCVNESVSVSISVSSCDTDADGDGLLGGLEAALGTDPNDVDSDNDLINDNIEVGPDTENPLDEDGDGIIDALDSNLADSDSDGVVDQLDPANTNACIPDNTNILCDEPIDLEVLKVIDNPNAVVGDEVTFTITVNNLGPRTAQTIIIGDFLESGFEYRSHIPSRGTYDQDTGQWQLSDLASGTDATLSIAVTVIADENEMYSNTAELLSSEPLDSNPSNDSSTVTLGVEQPEGVTLAIEKTARLGPDTQRLQQLTGLVNDVENTLTVEYFIKVTNESEAGMISNISVRDVFETDADITFEILDDANVPEGSTFNTASGIWTINRDFEAGQEIELSYTVVFEGIGLITNTAEIVSPVNPDPESVDISSIVTLEITTRNELEIGILYNQFSPNADGINDFLKVNNLQKNELGFDELVGINYSIDIYNRYGTLVYEASGLTDSKAWDGTWKGKQVPDGTYFYGLNVTIIIEGEPETQKTSKGWIQLIR